MSARRCFDCGANAQEATFPGLRKPRGDYDRCCDCLSHPPAESVKPIRPAKPIVTRAAYRAAHRYRTKQPQLDLVDLLVPPP